MSTFSSTSLLSSQATRIRGWSPARTLGADAGVSQALVRIALGAVLLPPGAQHLFGLFGGYGFSGTLAWMTATLGLPAPLAAAGIVLEVVGPVALIFGVGSRLAGLAMAVFMAVAASTHAANGFFMNWFGGLPAGAEGFEYHLLAIAMALAVAIGGGGRWSIDRLIRRR
jgi:putative oxidoreductase